MKPENLYSGTFVLYVTVPSLMLCNICVLASIARTDLSTFYMFTSFAID